MPVSITLSDETYRSLESLAIGFDTPERVIERLIEQVTSDSVKETKPRLTFLPDESTFKKELLLNKRAQIVLYTKDSVRDVIHWNAARFQPSSNLRANLWSGCLRNWKEKGITSAELSILKRGTTEPGDETELMIDFAEQLRWTIQETNDYYIEHEEVGSDDGVPYYNLVTFSEETPMKLKDIAGINSFNQVRLDLHYSEEDSSVDDD